MTEINSNSACNYAEQVVSFLYGEIDGAEKTNFEMHLQNCASCADELSDFSAVRTSVLEWRTEDFESLATPFFEIPGNKVEPGEKVTWLNSIRGFFTLNSIGFSAALTAILIAFGLLWFFSGSASNNEIAENRQVTNDIPVNKTEETQRSNTSETIFKSDTKSTQDSQEKVSIEEIAPGKKAVQVKTTVQKNLSESRALRVKIPASSRETKKQIENPTPESMKNNELPTLAIEEYEDKSLRLSDILNEVSMK